MAKPTRKGKIPMTSPAAMIAADTGIRPPFALEAFPDVDADVRQSVARIDASPFLQHKNVRGFVYEVEKGTLREVA